MNSRICYAAYSLVGISIVLTVLLGYPELSRSTAKVPGLNPTADLRPATPEVVEEIVTLKPVALKTSTHFFQWAEKHSYCGAPSHAFEVRPSEEEIPNTVVSGFQHRYDKGAIVFGCPDGDSTTYRGSVWFDLSDIKKKAPYPHLSVLSATLHFDAKNECPGALLVATENWMEGYPDDTLVPGDPNPVNKFYGDAKPAYPTVAWPPEGVSVDVPNVVTNWLKGEENGGYANYGFVFRGYAEGDTQFKDADACVSRFSYFTLTVKYRYDKESAAPDTYPIICRGIDTFKVIDTVGPGGSKGVGFTFTPGTSKAKDGLAPGQCSWVDRGMRPGEPGQLAQASESAVDWPKELNSSDSYWKFNVYNAGDQLQATSAERISKPSTDVGKPSPAPGGGTLDTRKNVALALNGASADAQNFTQDGVAGPGLFFEPSFAIDGVLHTTSAGGNYWRDEHGLPSYLEVDFHHLKTIDEIDVITIQVPGYETGADPSESDPKSFSSQGAENFEVKYLVGTEWKTVPNGLIVGNNRAFVKITFLPLAKTIKTSKIRVYVTKSAGPGGGDGIARIVELQAWGS